MKFALRKSSIWILIQAFGAFMGAILLSLLAYSHMPFPLNAAGPNLQIWMMTGDTRINQTDAPGNSTAIKLSAARGEYEPFQIGIRANQQSLLSVNVEVSNLTGPNGATIAQSNLTLYREHFVSVPQSSWVPAGSTNRPGPAGWYADGLIPFNNPETQLDLSGAALDAVPFDLPAQNNQPIWVDVYVPRNAPAGDYTGTFTVTSSNEQSTGSIELHVWNFELPNKPSLQSSFSFWEPTNYFSLAEMAKHRLMPAAKINPVDEANLINRWGLSSVRLPFWSGANYKTCTMNEAPAVDRIQAEAAKHDDRLLKYAYSADEIDKCPGLVDSLKQWGRNLHQAGVDQLVVMKPIPELFDDGTGSGRSAVDIWVVLPKQDNDGADDIIAAERKGDKVWSYTALTADTYSPKWEIDFDPLNFRILPGFLNQVHDFTGVLYWQVDWWNDDPWNNLTTYTEDNRHYPGEGMLVYPGGAVGIHGVAPSMRLKWIREGAEDYEYVEILRKLGQTNQALNISRQVAPNWRDWTRDPAAIADARDQLARAIEQAI